MATVQESSMSRIEVDTLVLGWGKAGKTLAGALGRSGRDVALVERSPAMYGGTCINIACVPTKALIQQAASRRPDDDPDTWFGASVKRRDTLIDKLNARNHAMLAEVDAVTLIDGQACFVSAHEVEVTGGSDRLLIAAGTVVVNTGSVPARPPIDGAGDSARVYDSTTLQHVDPLPRRLVIVGGGYVGLEFAGMFAGFGSSVCVIDRNETFLRREDRDVADVVKALLEEQGVELVLGAEVASIRDHGDGVDDSATTVTVSCRQGPRTVEADAVLLAAGRSPATTDLRLDAAGITTDARGLHRGRRAAPHVGARCLRGRRRQRRPAVHLHLPGRLSDRSRPAHRSGPACDR
jgi:probable pyridine nucleotide-disulfide oxidoreductase